MSFFPRWSRGAITALAILGCAPVLAPQAISAVQLVVPAVDPARSGAAGIAVDLLVLNDGDAPVELEVPAEVTGSWVNGEARSDVVVRPVNPGRVAVAAGGFLRVPATLATAPAGGGSGGRLVLADAVAAGWLLAPTSGLSLVGPAVEAGPVITGDKGTRAEGQGRQSLVPRAALSRIERTFSDRFQAHEPIYFIGGGDEPAVKFQFSLKYRIIGFDGPLQPGEQPRRGLHFGYSQRSLWDITAESSPFYDTSYMPELFFEWQALEADEEPQPFGWFTWLGWQAGLQHESNGRDGDGSRSLNIVYLRPAIALGTLQGWRLIVSPRVFTYVGGLSNNPTLDDYRGFMELRALFGHNSGVELAATGRVGQGGHKGSLQLDLTVPLRLTTRDFALYMMAQYFDGYGESLRGFDTETERWRFGFSLVR